MATLRGLCWTRRGGFQRWWAMAYDLLAANSFKRPQSCYSTAQTRCARECRALASRKTLANPTLRGRRLGPPNISRRRDMLPNMWRRRQTPSPRPRNAIHRVYIYRAPPERDDPYAAADSAWHFCTT